MSSIDTQGQATENTLKRELNTSLGWVDKHQSIWNSRDPKKTSLQTP